ncbi:MAG: S9 family peptidase [Clostridia bacterium]|nr:S9 family peptidase [Clostridia bacterium]
MISPQDYARLVCPSSLCVHADGRSAWSEYRWDGSRTVCIRETDGTVRHFPADADPAPAFSGDDLCYLYAGHFCLASGFSFAEDGWEVYGFALTGDGRVLIKERRMVTSEAPFLCADRLPYRRDADHGFIRSYARRLVLLTLRGPENDPAFRLIEEGPADWLFLTCHENQAIYARDQWMLLDLTSGAHTPLCDSFLPAAFRPVFSKDGQFLLAPGYRKDKPDLTLCRIWLQGSREPDMISGLPDLVGRGGMYADLSPDAPSLLTRWNDSFLLIGVTGGVSGVYQILEKDGALSTVPFTHLPGTVFEVAAEGSCIQMIWGDSTHAPQTVEISDIHRMPIAESDRSDSVPSISLSAPSMDGKADLQARLLLPRCTETDKIPLLVWVHGGPEGFYTDALDTEKQSAVARGFAVLLPNPRGSSGFGEAYQHSGEEFSLGAENDVLTLLNAALDAYPCLDRDRIGILGGSYGGYMAAALAGHTKRFQAAVIIKPVTNWLFIHFKSSQSGQPVFAEHFSFRDFLSDTFRMSPVASADQITIPTLIIHGTEDQQCPPEDSVQLYRLIRCYHPEIPCELKLIPGLCHAYSRDGLEGYLSIQNAALEWMEMYLHPSLPKEDSNAL